MHLPGNRFGLQRDLIHTLLDLCLDLDGRSRDRVDEMPKTLPAKSRKSANAQIFDF
jgi:hypothetical protein